MNAPGEPGGGSPPSVSVIVPTYQRRELVARAIASVLGQTHADLELIVVDDGSTDGTAEAIERVRDPRLRLRRQEHRGVSAARNAGLALARAELVAFLDSDDRWYPDHLAVATELLRRYPAAVLASTCPRELFRGRRRVRDARVLHVLPQQVFAGVSGYPSCIVARRAHLVAIGGFDESLSAGEDGDLLTRLALRGPFVTLRRRTVAKQYTRGGLLEVGRDSGQYLRSYRVRAGRLLEASGEAGPRGAAWARAGMLFTDAMDAVDRGELDAARAALAEACMLVPELSGDPDLVSHRLRLMPGAGDARRRLRHFAAFAEAWPDRGSDTAVFLRLRALAIAARTLRVRTALGMLAGLRPIPLARFGLRSWRAVARLASREFDAALRSSDAAA